MHLLQNNALLECLIIFLSKRYRKFLKILLLRLIRVRTTV